MKGEDTGERFWSTNGLNGSSKNEYGRLPVSARFFVKTDFPGSLSLGGVVLEKTATENDPGLETRGASPHGRPSAPAGPSSGLSPRAPKRRSHNDIPSSGTCRRRGICVLNTNRKKNRGK